MLIDVLTRPDAIHLTPTVASLLANGAFECRPLASATTIDLDHLDRHGVIEHDASMSRDDAALGNNSTFSPERWEEVLAILSDGRNGWVTQAEAARARYASVMRSNERHDAIGEHSGYGLKESALSFGESSLLLNILGDGEKMSLAHLRVFVGMLIRSRLIRMLTALQSRNECRLPKAGERNRALHVKWT